MNKTHYMPIILLGVYVLFLGCNQKDNSKLQLNYYYSEKNPYQEGEVIVDSVYTEDVISIEKHLVIEKKSLDSLINGQFIDSTISMGDLRINYAGSYHRAFKDANLEIFKLEVSNIREGYFSTVLYNPKYDILVKNYHGHGRVFLDSIVFANKDASKGFSEFTRKLMIDSIIFPKLPEPPPIPKE